MFRTFWVLKAGRTVGVVGLYSATAYDIQVMNLDVREQVTRALKKHNFELTIGLIHDLHKSGLSIRELTLKPGQTLSNLFDRLRATNQTGD